MTVLYPSASAWCSFRSLLALLAGGPLKPRSLAGGAPTGRAWVGGSAEGWGGVWAWVDGSLMNELPWVYSQASGDGSRIAVDHESVFHTVGDDEILWSVCQYLPA